MNKVDSFECKKFFRCTSDLGLTFFWLKTTFENQLCDAVAEAITTFHYPAYLADSAPAPNLERVNIERQRSSLIFDRWMTLALKKEPIKKPIVTRFRIDFALPFDSSKTGKSLGWLAQKRERTLEQHIFDSVLLLYLPLALSTSKSERFELERQRSHTVFSQRMDLPGYPLPLVGTSEAVIKPVSESTIQLSSPQESSVAIQRPDEPPVESPLTEKDIAGSSNIAKPPYFPEMNLDYDF